MQKILEKKAENKASDSKKIDFVSQLLKIEVNGSQNDKANSSESKSFQEQSTAASQIVESTLKTQPQDQGASDSKKKEQNQFDFWYTESRQFVKSGQYRKAFTLLNRYTMSFIKEISLLKKIKTSRLMLHVIKKLMETHYLSRDRTLNTNKVLEIFKVAFQYLQVGQRALDNLIDHENQKHESLEESEPKFDLKRKKTQQFTSTKRLYAQNLKSAELSNIGLLESQLSGRRLLIKEKKFFTDENRDEASRSQGSRPPPVTLFAVDKKEPVEEVTTKDLAFFVDQLLIDALWITNYFGIFNKKKGDAKHAAKWFQLAASLAVDLESSFNPDMLHCCAELQISLGNMLLEIFCPKDAIVAYNHALQVMSKEFSIRYNKQTLNTVLNMLTITSKKGLEKLINSLIITLFQLMLCYENIDEVSKALESIKLARWFSTQFLDSSKILPLKIEATLSSMKSKYESYLREIGELRYVILLGIGHLDEKIPQGKLEQKSSVLDEIHEQMYEKFSCDLLNQAKYLIINKNEEEANTKSASELKSNKSTLVMEAPVLSPLLFNHRRSYSAYEENKDKHSKRERIFSDAEVTKNSSDQKPDQHYLSSGGDTLDILTDRHLRESKRYEKKGYPGPECDTLFLGEEDKYKSVAIEKAGSLISINGSTPGRKGTTYSECGGNIESPTPEKNKIVEKKNFIIKHKNSSKMEKGLTFDEYYKPKLLTTNKYFVEENKKKKEREEKLKELSEAIEKLKNNDGSKPNARTILDVKIQRPDEFYSQLVNENLDKQYSSSLVFSKVMNLFDKTLSEEEFDKKEFSFANSMLLFKNTFPKVRLAYSSASDTKGGSDNTVKLYKEIENEAHHMINKARVEKDIKKKKEAGKEREKEFLSKKLVGRSSVQTLLNNIENYNNAQTEEKKANRTKSPSNKASMAKRFQSDSPKMNSGLQAFFSPKNGNLGRKSLFEQSLMNSLAKPSSLVDKGFLMAISHANTKNRISLLIEKCEKDNKEMESEEKYLVSKNHQRNLSEKFPASSPKNIWRKNHAISPIDLAESTNIFNMNKKITLLNPILPQTTKN